MNLVSSLSTTSVKTGEEVMISSAEIVCEGVTKRFPGETTPAVDRASFKIAAGDLVVFLGPSGCGKTTLLKMINRLYEVSEGKISIGGVEVHNLPATMLRRQIGYVIQQVGLFPHMTIGKNIAIVPNLLKWPQGKIKERVKYLIEMVGLPQSYLDRYPRQLSGGEQQRVGLARALAADPAILLMDEPFAAVDAITRERLQGELIEIHRKLNKTILFVTHDVEEAFRLADKIIVMKSGKIIQHGTPLEIVMKPENEFIQELVGTNNLLRKLSLIKVQSVLDAKGNSSEKSRESHLDHKEKLFVEPIDDLRKVLSILLLSGNEVVNVVDKDEKKIGVIGFMDLKATLAESISAANGAKENDLSDQ